MKKTSEFKGFSKQTEEFLWGITLNNEKPWFEEHKQTYLDEVYEPMCSLAQTLCDKMERTHGLGLTTHVSRIYRDARRLHGRGPYKDHMWFSLREPIEDWTSKPTFFFEINPGGALYGMGCYYMRPYGMQMFRKKADASPAELERLIADFSERGIFTLEGEEYKKSRGETSELIRPFYQKKHLEFIRRMNWGRSLTAKNLPDKMFEHFSTLVPFYRYFDTLSADIQAGDPIKK